MILQRKPRHRFAVAGASTLPVRDDAQRLSCVGPRVRHPDVQDQGAASPGSASTNGVAITWKRIVDASAWLGPTPSTPRVVTPTEP